MIDTTQLLTFSDVAMSFGMQGFNTKIMLDIINGIHENDTKKEELLFSVLRYRKSLNDFKAVLVTNRKIEVRDMQKDDFCCLKKVNAAIVALTVCNLSDEDSLSVFKEFIIKLLQSKLYSYDRIKQDCSVILGEESKTSFSDIMLRGIMMSPLCCSDVMQLFLQHRELFTMISSADTDRLVEEIDKKLAEVAILSVVDSIYEIGKKKALSEFVRTKSQDAALQVYINYFKKMLDCEEFDYDKYLEDASDSVAGLEEVIT